MEAEAAAECWDKVQVGRSTLKVNVVKNKKPNVYSIVNKGQLKLN